jgi:UrcA family protein
MRIRATILAIAALSGAVSVQASAATGPQEVSRPVIYSDLNLRAAAGRAELQNRIEVAARRMCNQNVGQSLAEMNYRRNCQADAVEAAAEQAAAIAS